MRTLPLVLALLALLALTGGTATVTTSDGTVQKGVRVGGDKGVEVSDKGVEVSDKGVEVSGEGLSVGGKKIFGKKEETK